MHHSHLGAWVGLQRMRCIPDTKNWWQSLQSDGGHICHNMFWEKSWKTRIFATLGSLFSSMVISILVKSMCWRSIRVVDTVGCKGTYDKLPPCCKQCIQDFRDFCIWSVIPGHQKHSHNKDSMWSCPQCPASWWYPFGVAMPCALATVKSRMSSALPLGLKHRYKPPWWIVKFCWFCKTS